jgi:hypothetical protein
LTRESFHRVSYLFFSIHKQQFKSGRDHVHPPARSFFSHCSSLYDTNIRKYFPQFLNHRFPELRIVAQLVNTHKLSYRKKHRVALQPKASA